MARSLWAIIAGYLVFGVSSGLFFGLSGRDPHADPTPLFAIASVSCGVVFAALGGFVTAYLARTAPPLHVGILAAVIAFIAMLSAALQFRTGSVWSEISTLMFMLPAVFLGGWLRVRQVRHAFQSSEELVQAVLDLADQLDQTGHHSSAARLRDGLGCLNGLTDGWALLLEAIEKVHSESGHFRKSDRQALGTIQSAVVGIVYRS
jgi:hypothetical protein